MTSTKELFAPALNYILREVIDDGEMLESGIKYLRRVRAKMTAKNRQKNILLIRKISKELSLIRKRIEQNSKEYEYYLEYFGYTDEDLVKLNIHPATDEEIQKDYEKDMKEVGYDDFEGRGKYTKEQHDQLVQKVHEFNLMNGLPIVSF